MQGELCALVSGSGLSIIPSNFGQLNRQICVDPHSRGWKSSKESQSLTLYLILLDSECVRFHQILGQFSTGAIGALIQVTAQSPQGARTFGLRAHRQQSFCSERASSASGSVQLVNGTTAPAQLGRHKCIVRGWCEHKGHVNTSGGQAK